MTGWPSLRFLVHHAPDQRPVDVPDAPRRGRRRRRPWWDVLCEEETWADRARRTVGRRGRARGDPAGLDANRAPGRGVPEPVVRVPAAVAEVSKLFFEGSPDDGIAVINH